MSTWNFVFDEDLQGICSVCLGIQKGWTIHIHKDRLDRLDKDGKEGLVEIPLIINPQLPFNKSVTVANGHEVCISHTPPVTYHKQKSALLRSDSALVVP